MKFIRSVWESFWYGDRCRHRGDIMHEGDGWHGWLTCMDCGETLSGWAEFRALRRAL